MTVERQNSFGDLEQVKAEHRALALLRTLEKSPGYRLNSSILLDWLRTIALVATRDELTETVSALERLRLIKTEAVDDLTVLELLELGQDVAQGCTVVEGVLRPGPGCPY